VTCEPAMCERRVRVRCDCDSVSVRSLLVNWSLEAGDCGRVETVESGVVSCDLCAGARAGVARGREAVRNPMTAARRPPLPGGCLRLRARSRHMRWRGRCCHTQLVG